MIRALLAIGILWALALAPVATAQRGGPASVFVEPVSEREFSREIEALGTLQPKEQVELMLNAADRVTAVYFEDGQRVRAGKTLLSLAQREQAALVQAAEATADEARRQRDRIARLASAEAVSQAELDAAQRDVDSAEANLRALQSRQSDRILVAPFDGLLGFRQVSVGSFVGPGDIVAILVDDSEMNLDFDVPSIALRSVQPGTEIRAETADLPGEVFEGVVATLDNRIDPVTRSVRVRARLPNPDGILRAGMFMQVTVTASPRRSLAVPEEAVQPVGPDSFVWLVQTEGEQQVARRVEVELGQRSGGYIEIADGLEAGDQVVTEGIIRVREGAPVRVRDQSMLYPRAKASAPAGRGPGSPTVSE